MKNLLYGLILVLSCIIPRQKCYSQIKLKSSYSSVQSFSTSSFKQIESISSKTVQPQDYDIGGYTGRISYSVPIYKYKDQDFNLAVILDYLSSGYNPNEVSSCVGTGWNINSGGIIIREIKGVPDDENSYSRIINNNQVEYHTLKGFYNVSQYLRTSDTALDIKHAYNSFYKDHAVHFDTYSKQYYDIEPDMFYYNFNGYSGSFYLWYGGEIKTCSYSNNANVKVELNNTISGFLEIILTTHDGLKYYFGGINGHEFSIYEGQKVTITGWKLYKIEAQNGRKISFIYEDSTGLDGLNYSSVPKSDLSICKYDSKLISSTDTISLQGINGYENPLIRSYPLSKIIIDNGPNITFDYIVSQNENYSIPDNPIPYSFSRPILNHIKVDNNNENLLTASFSYSRATNNNQISNNCFFLRDLNINNQSYKFDYYSINSVPVYGTPSIDYWGYYCLNSNIINQSEYLKGITHDSFYNENIINDTRKPFLESTIIGMLKKIQFPNGGFKIFNYEQNDYSKSVERSSYNTFSPTIVDHEQNKLTGGVRIKEVLTYNDSITLIDSRRYVYTCSNGKSSGIQISTPRYGISYHAKNNNGLYKYVKKISFHDISKMPTNKHIEYSEIKVINHDNSYTICKYTTSKDYPDSLISNITTPLVFPQNRRNPIHIYDVKDNNNVTMFNYYSPLGIVMTSDEVTLLRNSITPLSSFKNSRGLLIEKRSYNTNGVEIQKETFHYSKRNLNFRYNSFSIAEDILFIKNFIYDISLDSVETQRILSNGIIKLKNSFCYNNNRQLLTKKTTYPNGCQEIIKTKYVSDIINDGSIINPETYNYMINNNCVSHPLTQEFFHVNSNGVETLIKKYRYLYKLNGEQNNILCLEKVESFNKVKQKYQIEVQNTAFNKFGYVTESIGKDSVYTSYIMSYNNFKSITKAINIRNSTLMTIISQDPLINNIQNKIPTDIEIDYLHKKISSLNYKNIYIESELYDPISMLLIKKHYNNGTKNYFQYNKLNQLICVRDNNLNILQRIEYKTISDSTNSLVNIPQINNSAKLTCTLYSNGTLGNNNSLLRVGDAINLGVIFPVIPSQYYELDGYYVNGVLIPNPSNYIVQGDVQIEARTKAIISPEVMISYLAAFGSSGQFNFKYKFNGQTWTSPSTISSEEACKTISVGVSNFPIQLSFTASTSFPSLRITHNGVIIYENLWPVAAGFVFEFELTEFGPHEIVVEIP